MTRYPSRRTHGKKTLGKREVSPFPSPSHAAAAARSSWRGSSSPSSPRRRSPSSPRAGRSLAALPHHGCAVSSATPPRSPFPSSSHAAAAAAPPAARSSWRGSSSPSPPTPSIPIFSPGWSSPGRSPSPRLCRLLLYAATLAVTSILIRLLGRRAAWFQIRCRSFPWKNRGDRVFSVGWTSSGGRQVVVIHTCRWWPRSPSCAPPIVVSNGAQIVAMWVLLAGGVEMKQAGERPQERRGRRRPPDESKPPPHRFAAME